MGDNNLDKTPKWQRLTHKDIVIVTHQLNTAAHHIWLSPPMRQEAGFLSYTCFLTETDIKNIAHNLHLVLLKEALANWLSGWWYWEADSEALWEAVSRIKSQIDDQLKEHHEASQQQAAVKVHKGLVEVGLDQVKCVL